MLDVEPLASWRIVSGEEAERSFRTLSQGVVSCRIQQEPSAYSEGFHALDVEPLWTKR
jgi:hypothetical protein